MTLLAWSNTRTVNACWHARLKGEVLELLQPILPTAIQSFSRPHPAWQSENCESVRHEWLPAWPRCPQRRPSSAPSAWNSALTNPRCLCRSEEHTSELQSLRHLVC